MVRNLQPEAIYYELDSSLYDFKICDMLTMVEVSPDTSDLEIFNQLTKGQTFYHRSPELLRYDTFDFGLKCDIWSCGTILYSMLTGIPPFMESN